MYRFLRFSVIASCTRAHTRGRGRKGQHVSAWGTCHGTYHGTEVNIDTKRAGSSELGVAA